MKQHKKIFFLLLLASLLSAPLLSQSSALAAPSPQATSTCSGARFLTMPAWYRGLVQGTSTTNSAGSGSTVECDVVIPNKDIGLFTRILAVNIVEILLHVVAYISISFIIIGGFKYITSSGSPDGNEKGRKTITNAVIGLIISIVSIGIINLIFGGLLTSV